MPQLFPRAPVITPELRNLGKRANFAIVYGQVRAWARMQALHAAAMHGTRRVWAKSCMPAAGVA